MKLSIALPFGLLLVMVLTVKSQTQDPRCPALRAIDPSAYGGTCPSCFGNRRCRRNEICCRAGCGSICVPRPRPTRPPVVNPVCPVIDRPCLVMRDQCSLTGPPTCSAGQACCFIPGCGLECVAVVPEPVCPPSNPLVGCNGLPCDVESCPNFPDAICTNNFCGGCTAVFRRPNGRRISRLACTLNPQCPRRPRNVQAVTTPGPGPCLSCANILCIAGTICCDYGCSPQCIPNLDPRCPKRPRNLQAVATPSPGTCLSCASILCIAGTICCDYTCNPQCIPIPEPTVDPRCPLIKPGGPCLAQEQCPRRCPPRQICCPSFCGTACIPLPPDPSCPARPIGPVCVASVSCPRRCPPGLTCCPHPCGTTCIDTSQDRRCRASNGISTSSAWIGPCGTCRTVRCRRGTICCNPGCRPSCIPIPRPPVASCGAPRKPHGSTFELNCSNGYNVGSVCRVVCKNGFLVYGNRQITCQPNRHWLPGLYGTRCVTPRRG